MLENYNLEKILFLDIETVPGAKNFEALPGNLQELWDKKANMIKQGDETAEELYARAGIYAEFGKIVCISVGFIKVERHKKIFRLKSFYDHDEKVLLASFFNLLNSSYYNKSDAFLCGHNGKEFDFPYIARRGLINGLRLPKILDLAGKKPWEVQHLDTMQLWKFGDYKHYTSLALLAAIFNIPTPKDDIDGSMVGKVYWEENDLQRIATYCQKDVLTTAQLFLRFCGEPLLEDGNIQIINE